MKHKPVGGDRAVRLLPLLLLLIAAAAVLLGILQFRWISRVTAAEGARLKHSLRSSAARVLDAAADEVRVLHALVYLTGEEYRSQDWLRFGSSLEFWKTNSRFPDLLSAVYLVVARNHEDLAFFEYSLEQGVFRPIDEPQWFEGLLPGENPSQPFSRAHVETLIQRGVFFSPVGWPGRQPEGESGTPAEPPPPFSAFLAVVVDLDVLYREVIPFYMNYYLEAYPYLIRESATADVLVSSGNLDPTREAELTVTTRTPLLFWDRGPEAPGGEEERRSSLARDFLDAYVEQHQGEDPSIRFWLQRSSMVGMSSGGPAAGEEEASIRLEIYYPGGSIHRLTSVRRTVNLAISVGILLLLVASSVVLFRLYRNTTRLRATEQEFVASMSHELRTPIAVLQSTTENLKSGLVTDPQRLSRYGQVIHRETRRLAGMVESILLYSGLENNRSPESTISIIVDTKQLIAEVISSLQELAREARSTIRLIQRTAPGQIRCDPTALRLILENLLLNAIRHGLPDDRNAENPAEVRLIVEQKIFHGGLVVAVEDDGPGIPPKEARRIFDPFVRGEASIRDQRPGSGLGLHLVRRVVQILGGSITLDSPYRNAIGRTQTGCRFTVELPALPDTNQENRREIDAEDPDY
jgi:signal transduction histidine kinase